MVLSKVCAKFEPFLLCKKRWQLVSKFWKSKENLLHTGVLEVICVFVIHYDLKTHFLTKKLIFGRFIGRKVRF